MKFSQFAWRIILPATALFVALGMLLDSAAPAAAATPTATPAPAAGTPAGSTGALVTVGPLAGLPLDPFLISLQGGGSVTATTLAAQCKGYVATTPVAAVDYQGDDANLKIFFFSDGDTTLVVQAPDGSYLCNDNTGALVLDPTVAISAPAKGTYSVWVGSARPRDLVPGFLGFTTQAEMGTDTLALGTLVKRQPAPGLLPLRERLANAAMRIEEVNARLADVDRREPGDEPVTLAFKATGELPAPEIQTGDTLCGGLVSLLPDYAFDWTGETDVLSLFVEADNDTTLLVRTPDGSFLCADDSVDGGTSNLNPLLQIAAPAEGRYLVWVGRVDETVPAAGELTIIEAADAQPARLGQP